MIFSGDHARQSARPLLMLFGVAALLCVLGFQFSRVSRETRLPFRLDQLSEVAIRVDSVEARQIRIREQWRHGSIRSRPARFITSDEFGPGVSFRLAQDAQTVASPAVGSVLHAIVTRDPHEAKRLHEKYPNSTFEIEIVGLRRGGEMIVDPMRIYEIRRARKGRYAMFAWLSWLGAVGTAAIGVMKLRRTLSA